MSTSDGDSEAQLYAGALVPAQVEHIRHDCLLPGSSEVGNYL